MLPTLVLVCHHKRSNKRTKAAHKSCVCIDLVSNQEIHLDEKLTDDFNFACGANMTCFPSLGWGTSRTKTYRQESNPVFVSNVH